ncbi:diguanylate cyclase domain-containing protein [Arenimonas daejeonensis]|uniref:diguanylate cyclase domain-containing protein n=1 Tax=Arenimonas daejeonensis TaxID=370777 RepID=UPI002AD4D3A7|nr:diguanylate cyclase [Arenimonas daejeonensis]
MRELARLCADAAETSDDLAARYGGEELALLLPGRDLRQAKAVAERLRRQVEAAAMAHPASTVATHVTISIGVATAWPDAAAGPERLVAAADRALYAAKAHGRNRVVGRKVALAKARRH